MPGLVEVWCPHCNTRLRVQESAVGSEVECAQCSNSFTIKGPTPRPAQDAAAAPTEPASGQPSPQGAEPKPHATPSKPPEKWTWPSLLMLIGATALSVIVALVLVGAGMRRQTTTSTTYAADGRVLSSEGTGSLQLYGMVLLRSDDPTTFFPQLSNLAIFSVLGLAVLLFGGTAFTVVFLRRRPKGHTPIQHALRHTPKQIPAIAKDEGAGNKGAAAAEEGSYIPKPGRLRMEDFAATGPIRVVGGAIIGFVMGIAIGLLFWFVMARTSGIQMSADMAFVMPLLGGLGGMLMCPLAAVCAVKSRALSAKNRAQRKHKPKAEALSAKPGSS